MTNEAETNNTTHEFDISKFWVFRSINILFFISILTIFTILLIPIRYLNKERPPSIVTLDLNITGYSHAIKVTAIKQKGPILSVTYNTHNSDHIIGTLKFGNVTLGRDPQYLGRYVSAHYIDNRKRLPFRVLVLDVYPSVFVFRRFLLQENKESTYKQVDGYVYVINGSEQQRLDLNLSDLISSTPISVFTSNYEDIDGRHVTQYVPDSSHRFATLKYNINGRMRIMPEYPTTHQITTVTVVSNKSLEAYKVIITYFSHLSINNSPKFKELYFSAHEPTVYFDNVFDLSTRADLRLTDLDFEVNRYENVKKTPVEYFHSINKNDYLLQFYLNHDFIKYEIVTSDLTDLILTVQNESDDTPYEELLDRTLVVQYKPRFTAPPTFYQFNRYLYHTNFVVFKED
ncbi:uncharacterized protein TA08485 [Theileria annulata]|uniref:Uncharacterized protein n=1 Tax=Theileria annulata TaxID=5874 RepID=Q4U9L7_THEAN|nr:uncharacterized protein TA08485 [Theileria annulata]CAI76486.1 hypothetical protein TA08485 [Theileria annulata]|eukprot:XP_953111.1 hypothetical protein TA08485 [Theileria annulata]